MEKPRIRPTSKGSLGKPERRFRVVASSEATKTEYIFGAVLFIILILGIIIGRFN